MKKFAIRILFLALLSLFMHNIEINCYAKNSYSNV